MREEGKTETASALEAVCWVGTVECPCTTFEQDETCPVGYPSLLCGACGGKGVIRVETVVALAAEMLKIAEQVGGLEDPFAAWESIYLISSQHATLLTSLQEQVDACTTEDCEMCHRHREILDRAKRSEA